RSGALAAPAQQRRASFDDARDVARRRSTSRRAIVGLARRATTSSVIVAAMVSARVSRRSPTNDVDRKGSDVLERFSSGGAPRPGSRAARAARACPLSTLPTRDLASGLFHDPRASPLLTPKNR